MTTELARTPLERREALADPVQRLDRMLEIRRFEDRIKDLFAEGLIHGTTHTCQGQEAVSIGIALAARPTDWVCCTYRGHGTALALGMTLDAILGEITGRAIGTIGGVGGSMHLSERSVGLMPTSAIVGAGIPIAAGAALSAQVKCEDHSAVAVFGDGATNIGAFHEGLNLASIWKLPVVFVCENNTYGEYSRIDRTTPVTDLAVRAGSYAMPSEIVDGQEIDAVNAAMTSAFERARSGGGPTFLECKTYRYSGHSRADPGSYRPEGELDEWLARDPITLYRARLIAGGLLDEAAADELAADVERRVEECIGRVMASELADVASMFSNVRSDTDAMSGVEPVLLARLGETVDEVVVVEWLVEVGAVVQVGDPLVRVETDKVEVEVEAPFGSMVTELLVAEGDDVATGATICRIDEGG